MPSRRSRIRAAGTWLAIVLLGGAVAGLALSTWDRHRPAPQWVELTPSERAAFRVDVLNGSGASGEATEVASYLRSHGFRVEEIANAERFDYPNTVVVDLAGDWRRCEDVTRVLGGAEMIRQRRDGGAEVQVILGHDWSAPHRR